MKKDLRYGQYYEYKHNKWDKGKKVIITKLDHRPHYMMVTEVNKNDEPVGYPFEVTIRSLRREWSERQKEIDAEELLQKEKEEEKKELHQIWWAQHGPQFATIRDAAKLVGINSRSNDILNLNFDPQTRYNGFTPGNEPWSTSITHPHLYAICAKLVELSDEVGRLTAENLRLTYGSSTNGNSSNTDP